MWEKFCRLFWRGAENTEKLNQILEEVRNMKVSIEALQAAIEAETTVEAGVLTLLQGLVDQLANLEPTQEAIDALTAQVNDNISNLQAAIAANTPPVAP